jgi:tetratricopeptide (TPR) repeat protein
VEGETLGLIALAQALAYTNQPAEARTLFAQALQLARRYRSQVATRDALVDAERIACEYLAGMALDADDYPGSRAYMLQALQLCQHLGKQGGEQQCLYLLARLAYLHGDYLTALREYQQSLALVRTLGHQVREAYVLIGLGQTLQMRGDYPHALAALEQGLTLSRSLGDVYSQVIALSDLSRLHCLLGNATAATTWVTQLLQVLEKREVFPECRLYALNALAFHAQFVAEPQQALAYVEQAWQIGRESAGYGSVHALVTLGNTLAGVQRWSAATEAYEAAIAGCTKSVNLTMVVEPQAGLAQIALTQGDLAAAQAQVEAILPVLAAEPHAGYNDPFAIYLTCYQVLSANGDLRAAALLQQGYDLLQQDAAALDDESRHRFLTAVPIHRDLVAAYMEMQAQADQATT